jgi:transposase-like protein
MNQFPSTLFRGRHFDHTVIILCVRWYITYKLSYRDLVEMMAERGVAVPLDRRPARERGNQ